MQRSFALLPSWGRLIVLLALALVVFSSSALAESPAQPTGRSLTGPSQPIFLPVLMRDYVGPPPPSSFDLIDKAEDEGKISAETALIYKTFALFDDGRLPPAYSSSQVGGESGLFMLEVVGAYPSLSATAQATLAPFFIPPYQAGSWNGLSSSGRSLSSPVDWAFLSAASGQARVWYKRADAEMQRKAGVIAAALTNEIWPQEHTLMGRIPIPDSAGFQNIVVFDRYRSGWEGAFVPYGTAAGVAVPETCSETPAIIYINPKLPDSAGVRSRGKIGLIETVAHEFMHALQFSYPLAVDPCKEYEWLAEATATWAEDFVYPTHDSEWRMAQSYLDSPDLTINNRYENRDYGLYLLVSYYTHQYDDQAVRTVWEAAGYVDSLESFAALLDLGGDQFAALWNKEPFDTFFRDEDMLPYQVKLENPGDETLTAAGGFKEYSLGYPLRAGAAVFFHYTVDPSVRTLTFLNGLTTKITRGPYEGDPEDFIYNQEDALEEYSRGALVVPLVKFAGSDTWNMANFRYKTFCLDWAKQRVSELLVVMINTDMTDRERYLDRTGEQTKILVTSTPCMKLQGTAKKTYRFANVTETLSVSGLEFVMSGFDPTLDREVDLFEERIEMNLTKGSATWGIKGTDDNGCSYSGSDSFNLTEENNWSYLSLYPQFLPGSRRFLGYDGTGSSDYPEVTYTMKCPDSPPEEFSQAAGIFFMPDGTIPVKPDGSLQGVQTIDEGGGATTRFEWNLRPITIP